MRLDRLDQQIKTKKLAVRELHNKLCDLENRYCAGEKMNEPDKQDYDLIYMAYTEKCNSLDALEKKRREAIL